MSIELPPTQPALPGPERQHAGRAAAHPGVGDGEEAGDRRQPPGLLPGGIFPGDARAALPGRLGQLAQRGLPRQRRPTGTSLN